MMSDCYDQNACSPPEFIYWKSNALGNGMRRASGKLSGHEGWSLMNGIRALTRGPRGAPLPIPPSENTEVCSPPESSDQGQAVLAP